MKTKLVHIKYFKWTGDPIIAKSELDNDDNIKVEFKSKDLILRSIKSDNFIRIKRGVNVVAILDPRTNGYEYFNMSDAQLDDYVNTANKDSNILLN